jgi:hypothetical protein
MMDSVSPAAAALVPGPQAPTNPASGSGSSVGAVDNRAAADPAGPSKTAQSTTRLMIEPDGAQGYVYRLVDSATGRVLVELPRERLDELKSHPAYAAGALASRSA